LKNINLANDNETNWRWNLRTLKRINCKNYFLSHVYYIFCCHRRGARTRHHCGLLMYWSAVCYSHLSLVSLSPLLHRWWFQICWIGVFFIWICFLVLFQICWDLQVSVLSGSLGSVCGGTLLPQFYLDNFCYICTIYMHVWVEYVVWLNLIYILQYFLF
jgi:hypothetical protein